MANFEKPPLSESTNGSRKLFSGLTWMSLGAAGAYAYEPPTARYKHYMSYLNEDERFKETGKEVARNLRHIMKNGVWLVPPEERPPLRPDLTYPDVSCYTAK